MTTLGDVREIGKSLESEITTLGIALRWGEKYSIPHFLFPILHPHLKQYYPKLTLLLAKSALRNQGNFLERKY